MSSDGELEEEVDLEKDVTEEESAQAAEKKVQANKAFAGELWSPNLATVCKKDASDLFSSPTSSS